VLSRLDSTGPQRRGRGGYSARIAAALSALGLAFHAFSQGFSDVPYEITYQNAAQMQTIIDLGFDISHVEGNHATVYANGAALEILSHLGIGYRQVDIGPIPEDWGQPGQAKALGEYHNFDDLTAALQDFANDHPTICRLSSLGVSVQGRDLWALEISDNLDVEEDEPEFRYVSTMHGNEPVGTEMLLYLVDYMLTGYGSDDRITRIIDNTMIWIVPLMNPDGHAVPQRFNAHGFDLNRSFPIYGDDFTGTWFDGEPLHDDGREPEVRAIMRWSVQNRFVLAANMHTGALVVNYPYDDDGKPNFTYAASPDDDLYIDISLRYSQHNPPMFNSLSFQDGITNGAEWYIIRGGMQDWNYRYLGCNEVTLELSSTYIPAESKLADLWDDNRESMLRYLEAVNIGVRGIVRDATTNEPLFAQVRVQGNTHPVFTDPDVGDYHRMLLPGRYTMRYNSDGYFDRDIGNVDVGETDATRVDVQLAPYRADVDDDEQVGATDVQVVINAALGLGGENADVNDDGQVNALDVQGAINSALVF
jgi:hypothetical protein